VQAVRRRQLGLVAVDERVGHELARDRVERREHTRVGRRDEAHERHQQVRRVEDVAVKDLHEGLALLGPAARHDLVEDLVADAEPLHERRGQARWRAMRTARSNATQLIRRE
jgi:hypothetical protein